MAFKVPADIAKAAIAAGCTKCNMTWQKLLVLGFLAGAYIAFGALLSEIVCHAYDLRAECGEANGKPSPSVRFRAWLAPFDLGISHDADLRIVYREERGVYQFHLTAERASGDQRNWRRLTPRFILTLRKQLLMWRILSDEERHKYMERGERLFGQSIQHAS